jgi:hypothetical protein
VGPGELERSGADLDAIGAVAEQCAPDGTPWTALTKLRSDTPDAEGFIQSTGYAGRLVPVTSLGASAPAKAKAPRRAPKRRGSKKRGARRNSVSGDRAPAFTG